jgi:protein-L-isoaspartate(D-aspartate) O-methyltransferase
MIASLSFAMTPIICHCEELKTATQSLNYKLMIHFEQKRKNMIKRLADMGISDKSVLKALSKIPREQFLAPGLEHQAYDEKALPIGFHQTISHPYTVAKMTELLQIMPRDKILEIGTGSGYQAALLCEMKLKLHTIEIEPELAKKAKLKLNSLGYSFISKTGDGSIGWKAYSPYKAIIVTAGVNIVAEELIDQLIDGGRLVIPVGNQKKQVLNVYEKNSEMITELTYDEVIFVPMTGLKGLEKK